MTVDGNRPMPESVSKEWSTVAADLIRQAEAHLLARLEPPTQLFHFTDCDGLIGILQLKNLRASLATSLNDPAEGHYGATLARQLIRDGAIKAQQVPLRFVNERLELEVPWSVYFVSFCERADLALQWLNYGKAGCGVAIGIGPEGLVREPYDLVRVIYREDEQLSFLQSMIDTTDRFLVAHLSALRNDHERDALITTAGQLIATHIWMAAFRMKNPAFEDEREWRLVTYDSKSASAPKSSAGKMAFRTTAGRIVPYKEVDFDVFRIFEIILGASTPKHTEAAVGVLVQETLGVPIPISVSTVTVRP